MIANKDKKTTNRKKKTIPLNYYSSLSSSREHKNNSIYIRKMNFPVPTELMKGLPKDAQMCVELVERMYFFNLDKVNCIILPVNGPAKHIFDDDIILWGERVRPEVDAFVHSTPEFLEWLRNLAMRGTGYSGTYANATYIFLKSESWSFF